VRNDSGVLECGFKEFREEGGTERAVGIPNIGIEDDWLSSLSAPVLEEKSGTFILAQWSPVI
jgi:hypothetical protein